MKKKLLIVTPGYLPAKNYGGPVVSILNLVENFKNEYDIYIITSNHDLKSEEQLFSDNCEMKDMNGVKVLYLNDVQMNVKFIEKYFSKIIPDVVYINAIFHYRLTLSTLILCRKYKVKKILALRGGLCDNAIQFGKTKKKCYLAFLKYSGFLSNTYFQSTSKEETIAVQRLLSRDAKKIYEIPNLPAPFQTQMRSEKKKQNYLEMVFMSRIHPIKNLEYAIDVLSKVDKNLRVSFDIYGPIEDKAYWNKCQMKIDGLSPNIKVNYSGYLEHAQIPEVLKNYHLFILPTLSENYGHAIIEALESGCLTLISDNTPWNDIGEYQVGRAINLNEPEEFTNYIEKVARFDEAEFNSFTENIGSYLEEKLQIETVKSTYRKMFNL